VRYTERCIAVYPGQFCMAIPLLKFKRSK